MFLEGTMDCIIIIIIIIIIINNKRSFTSRYYELQVYKNKPQ